MPPQNSPAPLPRRHGNKAEPTSFAEATAEEWRFWARGHRSGGAESSSAIAAQVTPSDSRASACFVTSPTCAGGARHIASLLHRGFAFIFPRPCAASDAYACLQHESACCTVIWTDTFSWMRRGTRWHTSSHAAAVSSLRARGRRRRSPAPSAPLAHILGSATSEHAVSQCLTHLQLLECAHMGGDVDLQCRVRLWLT